MAFPTREELTERVSTLVEPRGLDVEKITIHKAGAKSSVTIAIDGDERPDLDLIEEISELISEDFDAAEAAGDLNFGAGYRLEVTTPGLSEPLTKPRHFRRQRGHCAAVTTKEGESFIGRIGPLSDAEDAVAFILPGRTEPAVCVLALDAIEKAVVEVEFSTPDATEVERALTSFAALVESE